MNHLRLAVFSDSHGAVSPLRQTVLAQAPDMVLHLGDYIRDADALRADFPGLDIRCVRGNCDLGDPGPDRLVFPVEGVNIFMTHGHLYAVKYSLDSLCNAARAAGAGLVLYGHTHQSDWRQMGAMTIVNPGSAGMGEKSYALITIQGGVFDCEIREL